MKLSVIVPTSGNVLRVKETIKSFLKQKLDNFDIDINIIENCSKDKKSKELQNYFLSLPKNFKYFLDERPGSSEARNRAVQNTNADVVAFIDDDVQISKRNPARIITKADGTSKSMPITDKPLISVVFEENTDENALRPDSPHQLEKESTFDSDSNDFRSNSSLEGSTAILSTKSSKTEEDKYKEHTSSRYFNKNRKQKAIK